MSNNPTQKKEWHDVDTAQKALVDTSLKSLFDEDSKRFETHSISFEGILFDYSKHLIDHTALRALIKLAEACDVEGWRAKLLTGEKINTTEDRAVLHTALRDPKDRGIVVDGEEVYPFVEKTLRQMQAFDKDIASGAWRGFTGKKIQTIVNIGIGGSHLGPNLVVDALTPYKRPSIQTHFVANIDGADLNSVLEQIDPETTLFLVASKTFTTQETMENARAARAWMIEKLGSENCVTRHFVALSTNEEAVKAFGIDPDHMFAFKDWVGGRYSLWSAIGLSIVLSIGFDNFKKLLDGAHAADKHFRTAELGDNIPVLMALLGIWYRNFWKAGSHAVLPYAENLNLLPLYLQQLDMESNGKRVDREGEAVTYDTAPVIFGQPGTNGQHAFYQMLHQGTDIVPCDFIGIIRPDHTLKKHHQLLLNNLVAQSQALMLGRTLKEANNNPHRVFPGGRPSSTFLLNKLDPYTLGILLAFYEHKIFVQGVIWNINSYDQFGVELGKELAQKLEKGENTELDGSSQGLLDRIKKQSSS